MTRQSLILSCLHSFSGTATVASWWRTPMGPSWAVSDMTISLCLTAWLWLRTSTCYVWLIGIMRGQLTPDTLNLFYDTLNFACIFYHFINKNGAGYQNVSRRRQGLSVLLSQCYGCGCPCSIRDQGISSHRIDLISRNLPVKASVVRMTSSVGETCFVTCL